MTLQEQERFIRELAAEFRVAAEGWHTDERAFNKARADKLIEVADKLRDFQEFLNYLYEQNTGKKLTEK